MAPKTTFRITTRETVICDYDIEADSAEEARAMFDLGEKDCDLIAMQTFDTEIVRVEPKSPAHA